MPVPVSYTCRVKTLVNPAEIIVGSRKLGSSAGIIRPVELLHERTDILALTVFLYTEGYQPVNRIAKPFAVDGIEIPGRTYHKLACVVNTIHIVDKHVYIIPACVDMVGYILISGQAVTKIPRIPNTPAPQQRLCL